MTRRLRREWWDCRPERAALSFASKESTKESRQHGDSRGGPRRYAPWASVCRSPSGCPRPRFASLTRRKKALYCPFLQEGVRNVAHSILDSFYLLSCALMLALILFQKGQGFFPSLPIAALLPRRWRLANSKECQLGCYSVAWVFSRRKKTLSIWCKICPISAGWEALMCLKYFCNKKGQHGFKSMLSFFASHEACRRMAAFSIQLRRATLNQRAVAPVAPRR